MILTLCKQTSKINMYKYICVRNTYKKLTQKKYFYNLTFNAIHFVIFFTFSLINFFNAFLERKNLMHI